MNGADRPSETTFRRLTWRLRTFDGRGGRVLVSCLVASACAGLLGCLVSAVESGGRLARLDQRLLTDVLSVRGAALTTAAKAVTQLGTGLVVYPLLIAAGVVIWWCQRRWRGALIAVGWLAVGQLVRIFINGAVARPRPPPQLQLVQATGSAFPSGHTTTATIGYGLLAVLIANLWPRARNWALVGAAVIAVGVGLSRIYLGVHWPTDVLGGWLLGVGWFAAGAAICYATRGPRASGRDCIGPIPAKPRRRAGPNQCL